jgi:hypothetical protein
MSGSYAMCRATPAATAVIRRPPGRHHRQNADAGLVSASAGTNAAVSGQNPSADTDTPALDWSSRPRARRSRAMRTTLERGAGAQWGSAASSLPRTGSSGEDLTRRTPASPSDPTRKQTPGPDNGYPPVRPGRPRDRIALAASALGGHDGGAWAGRGSATVRSVGSGLILTWLGGWSGLEQLLVVLSGCIQLGATRFSLREPGT